MTAVAEFRIKLQPQPDVPALVVMRTRAPVLFDVVFIDYSDYGCSVKDKIVAVASTVSKPTDLNLDNDISPIGRADVSTVSRFPWNFWQYLNVTNDIT